MEKLTALFSNQVGLELFTLDRLTDFFKGSKIFQKAKALVTGLFADVTKSGVTIESKLDVKLKGFLEKEAFLALSAVEVYIPRNLAVPYSEYVAVLLKIADELATSRKVLLTQTLATIGFYINGAGALKAHSIKAGTTLGDALPRDALKWIDTAAAEMSKCLSPAQLDEFVPFTKAFKRNGEVDELIQSVHELYARMVLALAPEIEKEALELYHQAEILFDMIQNDERYQHPSQAVLNDLTQRLHAASSWVEFYATYAHQTQQVVVALKDTVARLTKLTK